MVSQDSRAQWSDWARADEIVGTYDDCDDGGRSFDILETAIPRGDPHSTLTAGSIEIGI
ncbi:hypothetical protein [Tranquillimonas alkanivorans]|uniref:Uncharacterized protein n=1 Tax=Tranquillimonas alkanivorans TaxID=441119 RepID=A0A1I5RR62_9RHOB|nr:hypothetical protein [Tranquillimonas alkanivorans]SFP60900.1 hypothetical protein SAMN04488047_10943 [Tranquillimonas alkanivorans]